MILVAKIDETNSRIMEKSCQSLAEEAWLYNKMQKEARDLFSLFRRSRLDIKPTVFKHFGSTLLLVDCVEISSEIARGSLRAQNPKVTFIIWIKICVLDSQLRTHKYLLVLKECWDKNEK